MSSSETIIKVEGVSKQYRLGMVGTGTLSHDLNRMWAKITRGEDPYSRIGDSNDRSSKGNSDYVWALNDINFEVKRGEVVAIIGNNGAGKSTLLKILSQITLPTTGCVKMKGRVGSLLEVGTGFHPDLTGRDNVYINGAILGMRKHEIDRKFDEIVSFAGVERYIDTPVKRYSSGMKVRLGFSVAAHLEPEILIVDEVLAVGDAEFQKKCLGKMDDVSKKEGRTILFVSHNLGVIGQLCPRSIWLDKGTVRQVGDTAIIVPEYLKSQHQERTTDYNYIPDMSKTAQFESVVLTNIADEKTSIFSCDEAVKIRINVVIHKAMAGLYGYLSVNRVDGTLILVSDSYDSHPNSCLDSIGAGRKTIEITLPARSLGAGDYNLFFTLASKSSDDFIVDKPGVIASFRLEDYTSRRGNSRKGFFSTLLPWNVAER